MTLPTSGNQHHRFGCRRQDLLEKTLRNKSVGGYLPDKCGSGCLETAILKILAARNACEHYDQGNIFLNYDAYLKAIKEVEKVVSDELGKSSNGKFLISTFQHFKLTDQFHKIPGQNLKLRKPNRQHQHTERSLHQVGHAVSGILKNI
jgi:hypothetical protein